MYKTLSAALISFHIVHILTCILHPPPIHTYIIQNKCTTPFVHLSIVIHKIKKIPSWFSI